MSETRRWTITSCDEFRSGVSQAGKPWTLHVLTATDESGLPVMEGIKAWDPIPSGTHDLEVEAGEYRGEPEWTVKLKNGQTRLRTEDQGNIFAIVAELERRLDRVERATGVLSDIPPIPKTPSTPPAAEEEDPIPF